MKKCILVAMVMVTGFAVLGKSDLKYDYTGIHKNGIALISDGVNRLISVVESKFYKYADKGVIVSGASKYHHKDKTFKTVRLALSNSLDDTQCKGKFDRTDAGEKANEDESVWIESSTITVIDHRLERAAVKRYKSGLVVVYIDLVAMGKSLGKPDVSVTIGNNVTKLTDDLVAVNRYHIRKSFHDADGTVTVTSIFPLGRHRISKTASEK